MDFIENGFNSQGFSKINATVVIGQVWKNNFKIFSAYVTCILTQDRKGGFLFIIQKQKI